MRRDPAEYYAETLRSITQGFCVMNVQNPLLLAQESCAKCAGILRSITQKPCVINAQNPLLLTQESCGTVAQN